MPERIVKLQPDRTVALRGFNTYAAAASIHNASPTGFTVSGTFRDPADLAVVVLYDADNYYEHPSIKYLPDFNFNGLTLNFNLNYTDGLQPIDSPKYNWIDWATLDCILEDGATSQVNLFSNATLVGSSFPAAQANISVLGTSIQPYDRLTLWFQNLAFDYIVPGGYSTVTFAFFANGTGTAHTVTVNGVTYTYTESNPAGESSADVASGLAVLMSGDPNVVATTSGNDVILTVRLSRTGTTFSVSASDGNAANTMYLTTAVLVAQQIVNEINGTNWIAANTTHALMASISGAGITLIAARYGSVNVAGTSVTWVSGSTFPGILPGASIFIANVSHTVAAVQSPTHLTLTASAGTQTGVQYVAPRGGRDGNLIQMYTVSKTSSLTFDQTEFQLSGGSSTLTWNVNIDFTAQNIASIRQMWLTFAPSLTLSAYNSTEWAAVFSNWTLSGPSATQALTVAGPGSVRIEEDDRACSYTGTWSQQTGFYSQYFALATADTSATVTVSYTCQAQHDLYIGTSLSSTCGQAGIRLNGDTETLLNCYLNTASPVVTRRKVRSNVPAGKHTVVIRLAVAGNFYFDFLEAAVVSDVPDALAPRTGISPAIDFDTDHTYKLSPARLMWIMDKLGYAGPMNEYLGVFWWNERVASGGSVSTAQVTFSGTFAGGDSVFINLNGTSLGKSVFPSDTTTTIATHFANYINTAFVGAYASAAADVLTIVSRSPATNYNLSVTPSVTSSGGTATLTQTPVAGVYGTYLINDSVNPPINRATRDWHSDFYAQCASRTRPVVTSCSLELVNPPSGYAALFPDAARTPVTTATGFGSLSSTQCAVGGSKMVAYQKLVYREIAALQVAAGLTPSVQYGEFLWWYFSLAQYLPVGYASFATPISIGTATPHGLSTGLQVLIAGVRGNTAANGTFTVTVTDATHFTLNGTSGNGNYTSGGTILGGGMGFYDDETLAAAQTALGRPLHIFQTPNDDPTVNSAADATFLRNRLRDHVAALITDLKSAYPTAQFEVLWPYDVNYPSPVPVGTPSVGGLLNNFVNLPTEWKALSTSGLNTMKVEALAFASTMRNLDLAAEAINLFPGFGWPVNSLRYLAPVFGSATPWGRELALALGAGIRTNNLWAFDHICLYDLAVPEPTLERRSHKVK